MIILTGIYFLTEFIVGIISNSISLIADSFHMLSDVLSLVIGLVALRMSSRIRSKTFTYGWGRAEIIGAFTNGVFLVVVCISILMEAIKHMIDSEEMKMPDIVVYVGIGGLLINLVGLFIFWNSSHHHHHHSGSHAKDSEDVEMKEVNEQELLELEKRDPISSFGLYLTKNSISSNSASLNNNSPKSPPENKEYLCPMCIKYTSSGGVLSPTNSPPDNKLIVPTHSNSPSSSTSHHLAETDITSHSSQSEDVFSHVSSHKDKSKDIVTTDKFVGGVSDIRITIEPDSSVPNISGTSSYLQENPSTNKDEVVSRKKSHNLNMRAIFLHILGDAFVSVAVIVGGAVNWVCQEDGKCGDFNDYKNYVDPGISIVIVGIILYNAIPLVKVTVKILLQAVPVGVDLAKIRKQLEDVEGVDNIHELHIWQLENDISVASVHIVCRNNELYKPITSKIKDILHNHDIHSATIQPEFAGSENGSEHGCREPCKEDKDCIKQTCCYEKSS